MSLSWSNIDLTLKSSNRKILDGVSGEICSGQFLAIMGPTGCGKTSLLNILAGRLAYSSKLTLTGSVMYDGNSIDAIKSEKRSICVVAQDDSLFGHLTVRETLTLAAYFSLGISPTMDRQVVSKVNATMKQLNLEGSADTLVGSSYRRGISGGEYKRLLLGKELMQKPDTIFLDEPTSGLDAYQALSVIESLRMLTQHSRSSSSGCFEEGVDIESGVGSINAGGRNGRKVIVVIHQPRSAMFHLFDKLLLLANGRTVYFGPANACLPASRGRDIGRGIGRGAQAAPTCGGAVPYFASMGYVCPQHYNPADFFLDMFSVNTKTPQLQRDSSERVQFLCASWAALFAAPHAPHTPAVAPSKDKGSSGSVDAHSGSSDNEDDADVTSAVAASGHTKDVGGDTGLDPRYGKGSAATTVTTATAAATTAAVDSATADAEVGRNSPYTPDPVTEKGGQQVDVEIGEGHSNAVPIERGRHIHSAGSDDGRSALLTGAAESKEAEYVGMQAFGREGVEEKQKHLRGGEEAWNGEEEEQDDDDDDDDDDDKAELEAMNKGKLPGSVHCFKVCALRAARWVLDFGWLLWRASLEMARNYAAVMVRCGTALFFAALLSLLYQDLDSSQQSIQDRVGLLYFLLINQAFGPTFGVLSIFPLEKALVCRELAGGRYKASAYFTGRVLAELPQQVIITVCYGSIVYWSVGLNRQAERFLLYLVVVLLTTFSAMSLGFFVGAVAPTALAAQALGPPVLIIFLLYGGFYINTDSLPVGSEWVRNISFLYWAFQALIVNEFKGETFSCDEDRPAAACSRTGEEVIRQLSFQDSDVVECIGLLVVLMFAYMLLAYAALLLNRVSYFRVQPSPDINMCGSGGREINAPSSVDSADERAAATAVAGASEQGWQQLQLDAE